jgi:radical SAM protein with 4Fe4S-binding SPASM domain
LAEIDFSSEQEVFDKVRGKKGDFDIVLYNLNHLVNEAINHENIFLEIGDITHFNDKYDKTSSLKKMRGLFPPNLPKNIKFWSRQFHNFCGHLQNKNKKLSSYVLCPYPWTQFSVTWNGNVVACCRDTQGKTILGNVFEQSIQDIWRGDKYIKMRKALIQKRVKDIAACEKCDMPYSAFSERWKIKYMLSSLLHR